MKTLLLLLISFSTFAQLQTINVPGDTPRQIYIKARDNFNYLDGLVNIGNKHELSLYGVIKGTVSGTLDVSLLSFRGNATRALADNFIDVYVGSNNGNPAASSGGNIAVGNGNLSLVTPSGTFTGSPWWSTFRGDRNIALGFGNGIALAGIGSNGASGNMLWGTQVLQAADEQSYNLFMGFQTAQLFKVPTTGANGDENVGIGNYVMQNVTAGKAMYNVIAGEAASRYTTSLGEQNIILGPSTARLNAYVGDFNTFIGGHVAEDASWTSVSGSTINSYNTGIGMQALENVVQGTQAVTGIAYGAGRYAGGSNGTYVGMNAGYAIRGTSNVAFGTEAGFTAGNVYTGNGSVTTPFTGTNTTFLGYKAGYANATPAVDNVILIGTNYQPSLITGYSYFTAPHSVNLVVDTDGTPKSFIIPEAGIIEDNTQTGVLTYGVDGILRTRSILRGSATLDFPSTLSTAVSRLTITLTGAVDGDVVSLGTPNVSITATGTWSAWVSAANTVTVQFSPKATEDPASGIFKVTVIK